MTPVSFPFQRDKNSKIGLLGRPSCGSRKDGRIKFITVRGILMHSSLAITLDGLPLGLTAIKFWTRKQFKGGNEKENQSDTGADRRKGKHSLAGKPASIHCPCKEPFELFSLAVELKIHFLVRTCVDRLAQDAGTTIGAEMKKASVKDCHSIQGRNKLGEFYEAELEMKYEQLQVSPPVGKWKDYCDLTLTVIHAQERGTPCGRDKSEWKLVTNLPVKSLTEAIEKLNWYAMRWKIEVFHKILKSGCKAEESKLRSSERLANLISIFCIIGWRVFWLTMLHRAEPNQPPTVALNPAEMFLLDELVKSKPGKSRQKATVSDHIIKIAGLGGYLNRASDRHPATWSCGEVCLNSMTSTWAFSWAAKLVGN